MKSFIIIFIIYFSFLKLVICRNNQIPSFKTVKQVKNQLNNMNPFTKNRILAMQNMGMSNENIASSINNIANNNKRNAYDIINSVYNEKLIKNNIHRNKYKKK